jgi:hemolysin III
MAVGEGVTTTAGEAPTALPKPKMRGVLHLVAFPVSILTGTLLLVAVADDGDARWGSAVYALSCAVLFGVSALYHRGTWSPKAHARLRRLDHSNIFLLIAGTYTPICLAVLDDGVGRAVLITVWTGALAGIVFRVAWLSAPPWLYTPFYVALGWVAIAVMPELWGEDRAIASLLLAGGLAYSLGGLVYARRRPDPYPAVFGYHEIFHACTLVGFGTHYAAVALAVG